MRRIVLIILSIVLPVSCMVREQEQPVETGDRTVRFHSGEIPSKTHFGDPSGGVYPTLWSSSGDKVAVSLNYSAPAEAAVTSSSQGLTADFQAELPVGDGPYVFRALAPASAVKSVSASRKAWSICIPAVQTPLPSSPDEAAQLIAATSASFPQCPEEVSLSFSHLTAYGRLSFTNLELGGARVLKVELTAGVPLCGDWYYDGETLSDGGSSSTLVLNTSATEDIWFATAPAAIGGNKLSISIYTDKGKIVKELTVPSAYNFKAGRISRINVDMSGIGLDGTESYSLVTDASTLSEGDKVLFVYEESSLAMGAQSGTYRSVTPVVISKHIIEQLPPEAAVMTLESGSSDGEWSFKEAGSYLAAGSSSSNQLVSVAEKTSEASWSISIDSQGNATVKAQGRFTRNWLLYNSGSSRFSCYAGQSSQTKLVQIYRQGVSGEPVEEDPLTQFSQYGLYLGGKERVYTPGSDQYSREYNGVLTFTILNPEGREQLEISGYSPSLVKGDRLRVSVVWRKGPVSIMNSSYDMSVVREEGPKVWLGNGTGMGFIIKK